MARFTYRARDSSGQSSSGNLVAENEAEALRQLRREGKFVVELNEHRPVEAAVSTGGLGWLGTRIKRDDVIYFANQLAVMIETGVPLAEALSTILKQTKNDAFAAVLTDVTEQVRAGMDFSAALGRYPKVFNNTFVALIRASESSGTLGLMLQRIAKYLTEERDIRKRVRAALTYPCIMLFMATTTTVLLLTFVLPRFTAIYAQRKAVLPLPTRILMGISNFLVTQWPAIIAAVVVSAVGLWLFARTPMGRRFFDTLKLRLPVLGPMMHKLYLARAARSMGTMIGAGVSMLEAVRITREGTRNVHFTGLWDEVDRRLRGGAALSEPLSESPLMPPSMVQMISAGERSGRMAEVLERIAEFTEADLKLAIKTATAMIEPLMIAIMGAIVGGLALALLLLIFTISRVVAQ